MRRILTHSVKNIVKKIPNILFCSDKDGLGHKISFWGKLPDAVIEVWTVKKTALLWCRTNQGNSPVQLTIVTNYLIMTIYKYLIKVNIAGICWTSRPCPESLFIPGELLQLLLFHLAVQIYNQHFYNNKQYNFIKGCLQKKILAI